MNKLIKAMVAPIKETQFWVEYGNFIFMIPPVNFKIQCFVLSMNGEKEGSRSNNV